MSVRYAFVTLLTSDAYLPGALTLAAALSDVHRSPSSDQTVEYETVCLVTPETVDVSSIRLLRRAFNVVIGVEIIVPPNSEALTLLRRPDLDTALTKLHVFRLTQYSKVIFLDADVLPLRPLAHLFHLDHDFSAIPDVGWPDIFNSGVMVLSPGEDRFKQLQELLNTKGTWDGADQGLLNEWRGNNWNRLSFTYNTTPTASYTYAPAYQRFGSQISAIHFIGPHKPWHSIPYRAPGSSAQFTDMVADPSIETPPTYSNAYDYGSLVDRWYSVYDRHYRSQTPEPVFQPTRYTSAWSEQDLRHPIVTGGALGLEELRRVALEGMGASGILANRIYGEGEYRSMPLEGRFDLIRPRTRAERVQVQTPEVSKETPESTPVPAELSVPPVPSTPLGRILPLTSGSPVRWTTLPTPGIGEIPPAPYARPISLPPTPLRHVSTLYKPMRITRDASAQTVPIQLRQRESGWAALSLTPLTSNSTVKTPPNVDTPAPTDTYFPKVWDIDRNWSSASPSSSETSLTTMEHSPSKPQSSSNALFGPSLVPVTPDMPRSQGQYRTIIGEENRSPTLDVAKVKRVFPWEERPRHTPGRVFPDEGSPLTALLRRPLVSATPERKATFRSPMPSPLVGFPPSFQPHHPSESRFPPRHIGKIAWSAPSSSPLGLENEPHKVETGSQDGDIEDEVDSEEATVMRSRSSSIGMAKHSPKYRSIGVQTDFRELREEGVQATTFTPATEAVEKRLRHDWSMTETTSPAIAITHISASSPLLLPITDSLRPSNLRVDRTPITPAFDEAGGIGPSSATSLPAISPVLPAGDSPLSHIRKGSRVWDPARGVEAFKRGSEEVLAKFMKTGSWEERA